MDEAWAIRGPTFFVTLRGSRDNFNAAMMGFTNDRGPLKSEDKQREIIGDTYAFNGFPLQWVPGMR